MWTPPRVKYNSTIISVMGECSIIKFLLALLGQHVVVSPSWGVFFSHPADFTPVCTTELGEVAKLIPEFTKRNAKAIAISCDPVDKHKAWIKDIDVSLLQ
jgi:alkyl hydroperoxide reductase subunit AhpC